MRAMRSAEYHDRDRPRLEARELLVFNGSMCTGGDAQGVVFATGMHTELGRIAALSHGVKEEPSPLDQQVHSVSWLIAEVAVALAIRAIVVIVYQQVENNVLSPIVYRRTVQVPGVLVLIAVLIGATLSGVTGALLAIPVAAAIQIVVRDVSATSRRDRRSASVARCRSDTIGAGISASAAQRVACGPDVTGGARRSGAADHRDRRSHQHPPGGNSEPGHEHRPRKAPSDSVAHTRSPCSCGRRAAGVRRHQPIIGSRCCSVESGGERAHPCWSFARRLGARRSAAATPAADQSPVRRRQGSAGGPR
jgi:hypothetical protein